MTALLSTLSTSVGVRLQQHTAPSCSNTILLALPLPPLSPPALPSTNASGVVSLQVLGAGATCLLALIAICWQLWKRRAVAETRKETVAQQAVTFDLSKGSLLEDNAGGTRLSGGYCDIVVSDGSVGDIVPVDSDRSLVQQPVLSSAERWSMQGSCVETASRASMVIPKASRLPPFIRASSRASFCLRSCMPQGLHLHLPHGPAPTPST